MEPANLHPQHQLQEEFSEYYSSLLSLPEYKVSGTSTEFNPGILSNIDSTTGSKYATDSSPNLIVSWPTTRDSRTMSQVLGVSNATSYSFAEQSANHLLLSKIKEEMPNSFPKLTELIYGPSNGEDPFFLSTKLKQQYSADNLDENSWLSSFSSGQNTPEFQLSGQKFCSTPQNPPSLENQSSSGRHNYCHIPPRVNISTSDLCFSLVSSSLDLNLRASDLLLPRYDGAGAGGSQHSQNNLSHFMQDPKDSHSSSSNQTSVIEEGGGRKKRSISCLSQSKNTVPEAKKHRSPPQSSVPPLKVRKEKLGDRIAALQRLAAPYGKTDTASVLTEAIRYIQFLHGQVQTLSVPYMRLPHRKPIITNQAISSSEEEEKGQPKRELRTRGLCLVPLSYASFFTG